MRQNQQKNEEYLQRRYENREFLKEYNLIREEQYEREDPSLSVQAYINNFSYPTTLEEVEYDIDEGRTSMDALLSHTDLTWTVPKWTKPGDIVFFMHAKTAIKKITALITELRNEKDHYSPEEYEFMYDWLMKSKALYDIYGGKIMAIGRVSGKQAYEERDSDSPVHFHSKFFSDIDSVVILENPVDLSEFKSFVTLSSGGSITPVFGEEFNRLRALIGKRNRLPRYVRNSIAIPVPLRDITAKNWMEIAGQYRRNFILEKQFRAFFVDYLLTALGDKKKIWKECRCCKAINPDSYADNVITFNGRYLPVEVKLNIAAETDLKGQVIKYCEVERCYLRYGNPEYIDYSMMYHLNALIIDLFKVYMYDAETDEIKEIYDLDDLHSDSDIMALRKCIAANVKEPAKERNRRSRYSRIAIRNFDISYIVADAIVSAANPDLRPGSGVSRQIFNTAGFQQLSNACKKISHCSRGSAVITPAFNLQAEYIIHAVGPIWKGGSHGEAEVLYSAYAQSLRLAMEHDCHSIAFPLLSAGALGYPKKQAWNTALKACQDFIDQNSE